MAISIIAKLNKSKTNGVTTNDKTEYYFGSEQKLDVNAISRNKRNLCQNQHF